MGIWGETSEDTETAGHGVIWCDIYLRLSDGRREGGTFAEREQACRNRAARRRWRVRGVVVENDLMGGSKSASAFKRRRIKLPDGRVVWRVWRPGFRAILEDLRAGEIQAILAEDLDRALRDPRDCEDFVDTIEAVRGWADSLSGSLRFTEGGTDAEIYSARGVVNHLNLESKDKARRVAAGRERTAGRGNWGGGRRPYGFTPVPHPADNHQNTQLVINEEEAEEIRRAAKQVIEGIALKAVARDMINRDVRTVTGTRWTAETLRDVLMRPLNAGIIVYQGKHTDVRLPGDPILHQDEWEGVVAMLTDPMRSTPGRAPTWLGTNIYECPCGSAVEIQAGRSREQSYRCAHEDGNGGDVHIRRNARLLDEYVSAAVVERLSQPDAERAFAPRNPTVDLPKLRRELKALNEHLMHLARKLGSRQMGDAEYNAARKQCMADIEKLEAKVTRAARSTPLGELAMAKDVAAKWERMTLGQKREVVKNLMRVVIQPVTRRGRGFDTDAIKIVWRRRPSGGRKQKIAASATA